MVINALRRSPFSRIAIAKERLLAGTVAHFWSHCVRVDQLRATVARLSKISLTGILASNTRLKKPTIISSQLWSPQLTSLVGSALSGLFGELSKCAVHSIFVPLGRTIGLARVYQSCQCQL